MRTITVGAIDQEHEVSPGCGCFQNGLKASLMPPRGARRSSHTGSSSDFHGAQQEANPFVAVGV